MNHFIKQIRTLSPLNQTPIQTKKIHQCPNCNCSIRQASPQLGPIPHNTPISFNNNYQFPIKPITSTRELQYYSPHDKIKHFPAYYNNQNIYYSRPNIGQKNVDSSVSSNNSSRNCIIAKNQYENYLINRQNRVEQHITRPMSPVIKGINNIKINIRYISPQPARMPQIPNNSSNKNLLYSFGQPKTPSILKQKKSCLKRMSSHQKQKSINNSKQSALPGKQKLISKQLYSIYNSKQTQSILLNPTKTQNNCMDQAHKQGLNRLNGLQDGYSTSYTIVVNSVDPIIDKINASPARFQKQQKNSLNSKQKEEIQKQSFINVNIQLEPGSQKSSQKYSYQQNQPTSSVLEKQQPIANVFTQEINLNYDYFSKDQNSNLSISQSVLK